MRRKVLIFGLVMALMSISLTALADDDPEPEVESSQATVDHADYMEWLGNGTVVVNDDYTEFGFEFEDPALEGVNHGMYVSGLVDLLKNGEWDFSATTDEGAEFDLGDYRLGCLVRQIAQSDLGSDDYEAPEGDAYFVLTDVDQCKKGNPHGDDWEPPGKAKKGDDWEPPGQAKHNGEG
jgi:hypothetical protein